jgi:hypothetical protein
MNWCQSPPGELKDTSYVICIDARGESPHRIGAGYDATSGFSTVLPVNQALDVKVVYNTQQYKSVGIKLDGTAIAGHTIPATYSGGETAVAKEKNLSLLPQYELKAPDPQCGIAEGRFPPRTPGTAIITVSATPRSSKGGDQSHDDDMRPDTDFEVVERVETNETTKTDVLHTESDSHARTVKFAKVDKPTPKDAKEDKGAAGKDLDLEFLVPKIYSGALRVGIAGIGYATNHGYVARKRQGSEMAEVVDLGRASVDPEVVVGYALFWEALTGRQGRDYLRR